MGRAKEFLSFKESIVYETHLHWVLFLESVSYLLGALFISALAYRYGGQYEKYIHYLSLPFWGYGGLRFLLEWIHHASADFIVTNNRVIVKVGVLNRSSLSIPLNKIESIEIDQTLIGRLLGYGAMHITGTGSATSKFEYISAPGVFRQKIQQATTVLEAPQEQPEGHTEHETVGKKITPYRRRLRRR